VIPIRKSVIDLDAAERVVFETFRAVRDAWLAWPARFAPLIAADLAIQDVELLTLILGEQVNMQLLSMSEPQMKEQLG
jgi:hypothetical protein